MNGNNMKKTIPSLLACVCLLTSCSDEGTSSVAPGHGEVISIAAEISQIYETRANDNGFVESDAIGVYVVDYEGKEAGVLLASGNRADNVRHIYGESTNSWIPEHPIYRKDGDTHVDIYGYYPYASTAPSNIHRYAFQVQTNQNADVADSGLSGYEASDFLWGKTSDAGPEDKVIRLALMHCMSSTRVELVEGNGFEEGEFQKMEKTIIVKGLKNDAFIDLSTGTVSAIGTANGTISPYYYNGLYRCIVAPQQIEANTCLFNISIDGKEYEFKKTEPFEFVAGKLHNFTIRIDQLVETGKYKLTLV